MAQQLPSAAKPAEVKQPPSVRKTDTGKQLPVDVTIPRSTGDDSEVKYERLKALIEYSEKRWDNLERLLAALVTVGTIFGFALGLSAYSNLKDTQEYARRIQADADKAVTKIRKDAEETLAEIRAEFPAIGRMNRAVEQILIELQRRVLREWDENSYAKLTEAEKQEAMLLEMTFSGLSFFEYHKVPAYRRTVAEINRGFGRFYAVRYTSDPPNNVAALERAVLYLVRAFQDTQVDVCSTASKDLGVLYALQSHFEQHQPLKRLLRKQAEEQFRFTLSRDNFEPGSLFGLSWLVWRDGRRSEAISLLSTLITKNEWRENERKRYLRKAFFNRSCYTALEGETKDGDDQIRAFSSSLSDLLEAKRLAVEEGSWDDWLSGLNRELKTGGDLKILSEKFPAEFHTLQKLSPKPG